MPDIAAMKALGWGDPGAQNSPAAAAFRAAHIRTLRVRGIAVPLNADPNIQYLFRVLIIFLDGLGANLDAHADDWGYANRDVRGFPGRKSYHAWGLAFDADALENPLGLRRTTFPVAKTRALCKRLGLRWGYDYTDRPDPMHFEFTGSKADAAAIVKGLRTRKALTGLGALVGVSTAFLAANGLVSPDPAPAPKPVPSSSSRTVAPSPTKVTPSSPSASVTSPTTPTSTRPVSPSAVPTQRVTVTRTATRTVTATRRVVVTATRTIRPAPWRFVIVRDGDTLYRIAAAAGTTVGEVQRLNPFVDPLRLQPGTLVRVR